MSRHLPILLLLAVLGCQNVERPTATVRGARLDAVAVDRFTLGVDVALTNPNDFALPLPRVEYDMTIQAEDVLDGKVQTAGLRLPGGATRTVTVPVTVRYDDLLAVTEQLIATRGNFNYRLEGKARFRPPGLAGLFGTVTVPFTHEGKLPLRDALRDPKTLADPEGRRLAGELFRRFFEGR